MVLAPPGPLTYGILAVGNATFGIAVGKGNVGVFYLPLPEIKRAHAILWMEGNGISLSCPKLGSARRKNSFLHL